MALLNFGNFLMTIEEKYETALNMLAQWCNAVNYNGTGWDDWDEYYKDAAYREGPLRKDLDEAIRKDKKEFWETQSE